MIRKYHQLIIGLVNQFFNILSPFIITLIGLKYLNIEQGSIWLIFLSMMVLINLFDFGLSPTTIRNVSYVIGGAQSLVKNGLDEAIYNNKISYPLFVRLLKDVKKLYSGITFSAFLLIVIGGGGYFYLVAPETLKTEVILSWSIYSAGLLLNLYFLYYTPILCGLGVIQHAYYANIIGRFFWLVSTILAVLYYPNLIGFSVAFLFSVIANRMAIVFYYNQNVHIVKSKGITGQDESTIPYIAHNTIKLGVVSLGSFMISRSTVLIAGAFLPLITAGEYTFSLQVYMALLAVGNVFITVKIPELSRLVIKKDKEAICGLILKVLLFSAGIYVSGFFTFYILSDFIIQIIQPKFGFLDDKYLLILGVVFFLELMHSICATIITTTNKVPFVKPAIISGVLIVVSSLLLLKFTGLGVFGLIVAQGIVQLMYNNWKWPVFVYKEFFKDDKR